MRRLFRVVTADGDVVRASQENTPTYSGPARRWWELRVVTDFEYRLHPSGPGIGAEFSFRPAGVRGAPWLARICFRVPRQATLTASIGPGEMVTVGFVWVGDRRRALDSCSPPTRLFGRPESSAYSSCRTLSFT